MINSIGELILLIIYWAVVNVIAQISGPSIRLLKKNRIMIFITCFAAMILHAFVWDDIKIIIVPMLKFMYGPFLSYGMIGSFYFCFLAIIPMMIVGCIIMIFTAMLFYIPAKFLQAIGLELSGGGMHYKFVCPYCGSTSLESKSEDEYTYNTPGYSYTRTYYVCNKCGKSFKDGVWKKLWKKVIYVWKRKQLKS